MLRLATILLAIAVPVTCVSALMLANDGAASMAAGGIQLRKEAHVSMEKERLTISVHKVTVEYEFLNESDTDITTEVAFPIPEYSSTLDTFNAPPDFPDFRLWIDGRPIAPHTELQALVKGVNQAGLLTRFGIDIVHFGGYEKYLEHASEYQILRLSEDAQDELVQAGLISSPDKRPQWTVHTTHYWTTTFPAHKPVQVRHEYTPVAGQAQMPWDYFRSEVAKNSDAAPSGDMAHAVWHLVDKACFDPRAKKTGSDPSRQNVELTTRGLSAWSSGLVVMDFVDYILTTANTWKGPIKEFELVVDDTNPWDGAPFYVNFCWDGPVERLDAHHLSARKRNFVPNKELSVFFIRRPERVAP